MSRLLKNPTTPAEKIAKYKAQIKALDGSIGHWVALREKIPGQSIGWWQCSCCNLKFADSGDSVGCIDDACEGCPIFEYTGHVGCDYSPYEEIANSDVGQASEDFPAMAQKEIDFLRHVRRNIRRRLARRAAVSRQRSRLGRDDSRKER